MNRYYVDVRANKQFYVSAKSKGEARKKAIRKFKKTPGKLDIEIDKQW